MATNQGNTARDSATARSSECGAFFVPPNFGPPHKCRRCAVEIQLVQRSFGRSAFEETATGRNHRYNCAVKDAETAALIAKVMEPEYMPEEPQPRLPKRPLDPIRGMDIGTLDE